METEQLCSPNSQSLLATNQMSWLGIFFAPCSDGDNALERGNQGSTIRPQSRRNRPHLDKQALDTNWWDFSVFVWDTVFNFKQIKPFLPLIHPKSLDRPSQSRRRHVLGNVGVGPRSVAQNVSVAGGKAA